MLGGRRRGTESKLLQPAAQAGSGQHGARYQVRPPAHFPNPVTQAQPPLITCDETPLATLDDQILEAIADAKAPNTKRAYRADWAHFSTWCEAHGETPLPASPATVARYLVAHAKEFKRSTLERRLIGITTAHRFAGHDTPCHNTLVRETMKGIRRQKADEDVRQVDAAVTSIVRQLVDTLKDDIHGLRNRALLLIGFAGAFRRSELVALKVHDIKETREGLVIRVRRSKTDQEGKGLEKGIPYGSHIDTCPVRSYKAWLEASKIVEGPVFRPISRHGHVSPNALRAESVAEVIKAAAQRAGLDPTRFAGHSLRSGLATAAAEAGVPEQEIMEQGGWKSSAIARRYIRRGSLFKRNAASKVGL